MLAYSGLHLQLEQPVNYFTKLSDETGRAKTPLGELGVRCASGEYSLLRYCISVPATHTSW